MRSSYSPLMQSQYFHPSFNSAIFDGPLRVYFAQFQESFALKVYFLIQKNNPELWQEAREVSKNQNAQFFILVYPNEESFFKIFGNQSVQWLQQNWNEDSITALKSPLEEEQMDEFLQFTQKKLVQWIAELKKNSPWEIQSTANL